AARTKTVSRTAAAMTRTSMIRLNSKGVPSKKIADGKKSATVGAWNSPSPSAASSRGNAGVDRGVSRRSYGPDVPDRWGHAIGPGRHGFADSLPDVHRWSDIAAQNFRPDPAACEEAHDVA